MTTTETTRARTVRRRAACTARTLVVAAVVAGGALLGTGVADAAPQPPPGNYQTCVALGVQSAINASRSLPATQRAVFLALRLRAVATFCRNLHPNPTYTRSDKHTVTRPRTGTDTIIVSCRPGDRLVGQKVEVFDGRVRNLSGHVNRRPAGYTVTYGYTKVPTTVRLTITCKAG